LIEEFTEICFIAALTMTIATENQSVKVSSSLTVCGSERTHDETAPNKSGKQTEWTFFEAKYYQRETKK